MLSTPNLVLPPNLEVLGYFPIQKSTSREGSSALRRRRMISWMKDTAHVTISHALRTDSPTRFYLYLVWHIRSSFTLLRLIMYLNFRGFPRRMLPYLPLLSESYRCLPMLHSSSSSLLSSIYSALLPVSHLHLILVFALFFAPHNLLRFRHFFTPLLAHNPCSIEQLKQFNRCSMARRSKPDPPTFIIYVHSPVIHVTRDGRSRWVGTVTLEHCA